VQPEIEIGWDDLKPKWPKIKEAESTKWGSSGRDSKPHPHQLGQVGHKKAEINSQFSRVFHSRKLTFP